MENVTLNIRALAAMKKISIEKLAELSDIDPTHLVNVSAGRVKMTGRDLINLAKATGVNPFNIEVD